MSTGVQVGKTGSVKNLNKEARERVEEHSGEIVDALMESTRKGHSMSTRLLIQLAEGPVETGEGNNRSLAIDLAKEPQWPDDDPPEDEADEEAS
jgi:hypothetical protein